MSDPSQPGLGDVTCIDAEEADELDVDGEPAPALGWLKRGETIGRYVVLECLGVGGMGIIYSAWDPKLERKLAIKLVRSRHGGLGSRRSRARLEREAQALARLLHPNVITVHDVGTHEGRLFVAMEYIKGQTLQHWLRRCPERDVAALINVFLQVGRGLAAAHRAGLVHRDVKPDNVMLGEDGRVLVLDFGIAREPARGYAAGSGEIVPTQVDDDDDDDDDDLHELEPTAAPGVPMLIQDQHTPLADLTRAGALVGTPAYMSPEQHRSQRLDARSDQFSYCVAMWEALNGERPFGEGPREKLIARMRLGQLRAVANPELPEHVVAALRRGLAWKPEDRFETMEALLEALNPRGPREAKTLGPSRRPWLLALAGLGLIALASSLSLWLSRDRDPEEPAMCRDGAHILHPAWNEARALELQSAFRATGLERADGVWVRTRGHIDDWSRRWIAARDEACAAHFLRQEQSAELHDRRVACLERQRAGFIELAELLTQVDERPAILDRAVAASVELPDPSSCSAATLLEPTVPEPGSDRDRQRLAELRADLDGLELRFELGEYDDGVEPSRQLVSAAETLGYAPLLARALQLQGNYLARSDELDGAQRALSQAGAAAAEIRDPELQARILVDLATALSESDAQAEAERWLLLATGLSAGLSDPPLSLRVSLASSRGSVAQRSGRYEEARASFEAARAMLEAEGDPELQLPLVLQNLGVCTSALGDDEQAVLLLRRSIVLFEQAYGPEHPRIATARINLATSLARLGEHEAALGEHRRALALFELAHGPGRHTGFARAQIGRELGRLGRCEAAEAAFDQALAELDEHGRGSELHIWALDTAALACRGRLPEARARAQRAVDLAGELGRASVGEQLSLALVEVGAGELDGAAATLDELAAQLDDATTAETRARFAAVVGLREAAEGRSEAARELLTAAETELGPGTLRDWVGEALADMSPPR